MARATTDRATFCWIGDVFVEESVRGIGLGTWLVGTVVAHQKSLGVPRFLLATRDAHGVYERLGFRSLLVPDISRARRAPDPSPSGRRQPACEHRLGLPGRAPGPDPGRRRPGG